MRIQGGLRLAIISTSQTNIFFFQCLIAYVVLEHQMLYSQHLFPSHPSNNLYLMLWMEFQVKRIDIKWCTWLYMPTMEKIVCNFYIHVIKCEVWCSGVGGQKQIWNGVLWNPKSRRSEMKWDPLHHMLCGLYNSSIWCCLFFYAYCMTSKSCEFGILQF